LGGKYVVFGVKEGMNKVEAKKDFESSNDKTSKKSPWLTVDNPYTFDLRLS
jgi:hypothetical protein